MAQGVGEEWWPGHARLEAEEAARLGIRAGPSELSHALIQCDDPNVDACRGRTEQYRRQRLAVDAHGWRLDLGWTRRWLAAAAETSWAGSEWRMLWPGH